MTLASPLTRSAPAIACVLCLVLMFVGGCDSRTSILEAHADASLSVGRTATAAAMSRDLDRGVLKFGEAMTLAFERLEPADGTEPGEGATVFAGSVLELAVLLGDRLPQGSEHELFWMQVGQLAYLSAHVSSSQGRAPEAWSLVLAGPDRWKRDSYWRRYTNHDALVSVLMSLFGDHREAVSRLDRLGVDDPAYDEARRLISELKNAQRGG